MPANGRTFVKRARCQANGPIGAKTGGKSCRVATLDTRALSQVCHVRPGARSSSSCSMRAPPANGGSRVRGQPAKPGTFPFTRHCQQQCLLSLKSCGGGFVLGCHGALQRPKLHTSPFRQEIISSCGHFGALQTIPNSRGVSNQHANQTRSDRGRPGTNAVTRAAKDSDEVALLGTAAIHGSHTTYAPW
jgi:hypothetical protein